MSSCIPVGSCWRPVEPSRLLASAGEDAAVAPLVSCAAHLRGGLTTTAWASSWVHPLGAVSHLLLLLACRQVGRGSLGHPVQCSWHCIVLPSDLPCFSRGCGTHLYQGPVLRRVLPWPYRYLHTYTHAGLRSTRRTRTHTHNKVGRYRRPDQATTAATINFSIPVEVGSSMAL